MKKNNYISPEIKVIALKSETIICSSDSVISPEKGYGFDWDDDLY